MAETENWMTHSSLAHLEKLDENAVLLRAREPKPQFSRTKRDTLKQEVKQLREKRDRLKERVRNTQQVLGELQNKPAAKTSSKLTKRGDVLMVLKKQKLEDLLLAYRLTGLSVTVVKTGVIRLCFDTIHNGHFLEPYYVELKTKQTEDILQITHHTLPAFFPVEALEEKLQEGVQEFCRSTQDLLWAFVKRRQEALDVQNIHRDKLIGTMHCQMTPAFDVIHFTLAETPKVPSPVAVRLVYQDLAQCFPSSVEIKLADSDMTEEEQGQIVQELTALLQTTTLLDAVNELCKAQT